MNSKIYEKVLIAAVGLIFFVAATASAQRLSLGTNLVYDATLSPNLTLLMSVDSTWSVGATIGINAWDLDGSKNKKLRHLLIAPELRHWNHAQQLLRLPKGHDRYRSHTGYWGLNLVYSHYNVGGITFPFGLYRDVRHHRLQGDLAAAGAFLGHTWRVSRLLRFEAEAGLAAGYTWFKKYDCPRCGTFLGRDSRAVLIPKIALNIVIDPQQKATAPMTPPVATGNADARQNMEQLQRYMNATTKEHFK